MEYSVADSGEGHTKSGPPKEMKRCSIKMCQQSTEKEYRENMSSWMHVDKIALLSGRKVYSI
jgi:hypothetical protein